MHSKEKLLRGAKLYLILDRQVSSYRRLFEITKESLRSGVDIIQLRDKNGTAKEILKFSRELLKLIKGRVPFILNDRADLAASVGAAGVHLGQDDLPFKDARRLMGSKAIIGVSCQEYAQAKKAEGEGADYIGFGSVFKTLTKPRRCPMDIRLLQKAVRNIKAPVFAIGGIDAKNIGMLKDLGVTHFAVCRAVCQAGNITQAVRDFKSEI